MKGKTGRTATTINKPGTKTTTKTADGGQQYVRDTKNPFTASDQYAMGRGTKTLNPKIAEALGRASGHAINPKSSRLASNLAKINREHAEKKNQITRDYGDKKGRR